MDIINHLRMTFNHPDRPCTILNMYLFRRKVNVLSKSGKITAELKKKKDKFSKDQCFAFYHTF